MSIGFIIFNVETGSPMRWGSAAADDVQHQEVLETERLLLTSSFDVEDNKLVVYENVKAIRQRFMDNGAQTSFGVVDTDLLARTNLTGAAVAALISIQMDHPYAVTWAMKDNSPLELNAVQMLQFALEAVAYIEGCFTKSFLLREQINQATTMAELLAIDVTAGWPA